MRTSKSSYSKDGSLTREHFLLGIIYALVVGTAYNLALLAIIKLLGTNLGPKIIVLSNLIISLLFGAISAYYMGIFGSLGSGLGAGLGVLVVFVIPIGLKQALIAGGMTCLLVYAVYFVVFVLMAIALDIYLESK